MPEDVGVYQIRVISRLYNDDFDETYKRTFWLTVWDDPPEEPEPWFPPDPIYYDEWEQPIMRVEGK